MHKTISYILYYNLTASITCILCILHVSIIIPHNNWTQRQCFQLTLIQSVFNTTSMVYQGYSNH